MVVPVRARMPRGQGRARDVAGGWRLEYGPAGGVGAWTWCEMSVKKGDGLVEMGCGVA